MDSSPAGRTRATRVALALMFLGVSRILVDLAGVPILEGLLRMTVAAPAPKVFTVYQGVVPWTRGFEPFSTRFSLEWSDTGGVHHRLPLTPEVWSQLRGPFMRRAAYGAILASGGPVVSADPATSALFYSVAGFALCGDAPVLRELGVNVEERAGPVGVRHDFRSGTNPGGLTPLVMVPCQ